MQSSTPITQMRRQEQSSSDEGEDTDLSLPMMKQTKRQQVPVMKKRKWLLLLRVLDVRGRRSREPKKKSRVDEVGREWKKEDNTPIDIP